MTTITTATGKIEFIPSACRPPIVGCREGFLWFKPFGDVGLMADILNTASHDQPFLGWEAVHEMLCTREEGK